MNRHLSQIIAVLAVCSLTGAAPEEPSVYLIDAHGIQADAIVPPAKGQKLKINLSLSPLARKLLLEHAQCENQRGKSKQPEELRGFSSIADGEQREVVESIGQCYRWFDHIYNKKKYPPQKLNLPDFKVSYEEPFPLFYLKNHHGQCEDGYWLNFRKREDSSWWWYDAGRSFKGERATIKVRLRFDHHGDANFGKVSVDGKKIFKAKPGADSLEGEFLRRFGRARLWKDIETRSFKLAQSRLELLLGSRYDKVLGSIRTHPNRLRYRLNLRPGPSVTRTLVKAVEVMEEEGFLERTRSEAGVSGSASGSILALPPAMFGRGDVKVGARYRENHTSATATKKKQSVRVEFRELEKKLSTERSAFLYLCVLQQSISGVKLSTPAKARSIILDDVLAEAEMEVTVLSP